jgi:hypothetical protein
VVVSHQDSLAFADYYGDNSLDQPFALSLNKSISGRYVKVYIDSWYPTRTNREWPYKTCASSNLSNEGGGLNEVQVFAVSNRGSLQ